MATIHELMEGKAPGSVKIVHSSWSKLNAYFMPHYFDPHTERWYGQKDDGSSDWHSLLVGNEWQLWTPPKKKVTRYLWVANNGRLCGEDMGGRPKFFSEEEADPDGIKGWQRLDWSATEFEVFGDDD